MRRAEPPHIAHLQRQPGLVGVHRHMLGAVIGVNPPDVGQQTDGGDVAQQNDQPDDALGDFAEQPAVDHPLQQPGQAQRQHEEQPDAEHQRKGQRGNHGPGGDAGLAVPGRSGGGGGQIGRDLQRLDAQNQRFQQRQKAAHERPTPQPPVVERVQPFLPLVDAAVIPAHRQAEIVAAPNHHALDNRLAAIQMRRLLRHQITSRQQ